MLGEIKLNVNGEFLQCWAAGRLQISIEAELNCHFHKLTLNDKIHWLADPTADTI